jgi:hypothetical protein
MEISRWCKPPVSIQKKGQPRRGVGENRTNIPNTFAQALPRLWLCVATGPVRWLAPPANFPQPSGLRGCIISGEESFTF